jgi:transposase InsO family protein
LTVRDAFSRQILAAQLLKRTRTEEVRSEFETLFARYGLPKAIQTDNGPPFASVIALGGLTKLSVWWVSLGIKLVRGRPGCPQDNGAHERIARGHAHRDPG